jgi:hypothetical protein
LIDIDFLLLDRNSFKNSIFYSFNEGIFKFEVYQKITSIFESKGYILKEVDPLDFKGSFFSHYIFEDILYILDLNKLIQINPNYENFLDLFVKSILEGELKNRFFIQYKNDIKFPIDKLKSICYYISEVEINKSSVEKIIQYLSYKDPNIFNKNILYNKDILINSLYSYSKVRELNLKEFILFCEEVFLTCIDNNRFNLISFNQIIEQKDIVLLKYYELYTYLHNVLLDPSINSKYKLYQYLVNLFWEVGENSRVVLSQMIKVMKDLYYINKNLKVSEEYIQTIKFSKKKFLEKYANIPIDRLLKFSLILSKYEFHLNSGNFLFELKILLDSL